MSTVSPTRDAASSCVTTPALTLADLIAVSEGTMGIRAAANKAVGRGPKSKRQQPTSRAARRTGNAKGRPRTGRKDRLLALLRERFALLYLGALDATQAARLAELDALLTHPQRTQSVCADPDERLIRTTNGRKGVRVKREVLPREVSAVYGARQRARHAKVREEGVCGPTTPRWPDVGDIAPTPDQRVYQGQPGGPDTANHTLPPSALPSHAAHVIPRGYALHNSCCRLPAHLVWGVLLLPIGHEDRRPLSGPMHGTLEAIGYRPGVLADPTPGRTACRPTLPDQYGHSAPAILRLVKAGSMAPEVAFAILTGWPCNRAR